LNRVPTYGDGAGREVDGRGGICGREVDDGASEIGAEDHDDVEEDTGAEGSEERLMQSAVYAPDEYGSLRDSDGAVLRAGEGEVCSIEEDLGAEDVEVSVARARCEGRQEVAGGIDDGRGWERNAGDSEREHRELKRR
jgi:hypothetical protein